MKWIKVALAIGLLVAVSLTITMAGAAPDTSPTVNELAAVVTVDETETTDQTEAVDENPKLESWETTEPDLAAEPEEHPDKVEPTGSACAVECSQIIDAQDKIIDHLTKRIEALGAK